MFLKVYMNFSVRTSKNIHAQQRVVHMHMSDECSTKGCRLKNILRNPLRHIVARLSIRNIRSPRLHGRTVVCTSSEHPALLTREGWVQRHKERVLQEVTQAACKLGFEEEQMYINYVALDALLVDFTPNLDKMGAKEWAMVAGDASDIYHKIVMLKAHFPSLDLQKLLAANPRVLLKDGARLEESIINVKAMLCEAKNVDSMIQALPVLLEPKVLVSVLVTISRWFPNKDPLEVLEDDPELVLRAQEKDIPFDPVFFDGGNWSAPSYDSKGKLLPWQKYIRKEVHKKKDWDNGTMWNGWK
mmetsp:Transcript_15724/g.30179  ORF Transcript_15724/g.30179 Transcript_15724/m.30179 type:complete len:300 (+) Transcript_15724:97-996(+)